MPRKSHHHKPINPVKLLADILADREWNGESRYAQARRLGVPLTTLYQFEHGTVPRGGTLLAMRAALRSVSLTTMASQFEIFE